MKFKIILLLCIVLGCSGCMDDTMKPVDTLQEISVSDIETRSEKSDEKTVTVHVCGEVYFPGVYTVYQGSRVCDIIKQAGGFTAEADTEAVNQAKEVLDAEQIYIPSLNKEEESEEQGLININTANEDMLSTIPGIGLQRAKQIVEYRKKNGNFDKIEDIMNISGIKEGMFEKIAPYITVS